MSENFSIKFNGETTDFDKSFINNPENLVNKEKEDFQNLKTAVENAYNKDNMTYEKVKYYFSKLRFDYYTVEKNRSVKNYIKDKGMGEKDDKGEDNIQKYFTPLKELSRIIKVSADASKEWFRERVKSAVYESANNEGYNNQVDKNGNYDEMNSSIDVASNFTKYYWYQHKLFYKENPISLSFFLQSLSEKEKDELVIKVAIELHDSKADKTYIKDYFINKMSEVSNIVKQPERYGFSQDELKGLKYSIVTEDNPGGSGGFKPIEEFDPVEIRNKAGRPQFFREIIEVDKIELSEGETLEDKIKSRIREEYSFLKKLYAELAYSNVFERGIYKTVKARGLKQLVFNGAPGTGKTFGVRKYVESVTRSNDRANEDIKREDIKRWEIVQFHPSYDYTDFVEGIRPVTTIDKDGKDTMSFVKIDGEFKKFCRRVVMRGLKKVKDKYNWSSDKDAYNHIIDFLEKQKRSKIITLEEGSSKGESTSGVDNPLDIFNATTGEHEELYYFIIDEINRADISKVFGELMFSLEYRGIDNRVATQYSQLGISYERKENERAYSHIPFDCFEHGFFIPENVVIIGTMNDIDKSVESFDFAMRRRFQWIYVKSTDVMEDVLKGMLYLDKEDQIRQKNIEDVSKIVLLINKMNDKIVEAGKSYGLTEDYHIGPSYFKNLDLSLGVANALEKEFDLVVEPTLREYIRGRADEKKVKEFIKDCKNALSEKGDNKVKENEEE